MKDKYSMRNKIAKIIAINNLKYAWQFILESEECQ